MKKLSIKNITTSILTLCLIGLLSISCSSSDDGPQDPAIEFTSLETSKTNAFIEETITLNLKGTGYTDIVVTSSNPVVKINKVASSVYEISSTERAYTKIYVELKNNSNSQIKSVDVIFAEHGVKDFNTVEGIKVNTDNSSKVISLLGEPDYKSISTTTGNEIWSYRAKGLAVFVDKNTTVIQQIDVYSSNYFYTKDDVKTYYTTYPYEIGYGWKINNNATTMELVVAKLGTTYTKTSAPAPSINRSYQYSIQQISFNFYSDLEDDYTGNKIIRFAIY
ncbi:MAG TPA: hypothetical protein VIV55_00265 [Flavobacterium sp.]